MPQSATDAARDRAVRALSLVLLAGLWAVAAHLVADPLLLPGPVPVAQKIAAEFGSGAMARHMAATLLRVIAAFVLAMGAGIGLGLWMGRHGRADRWLDLPLILALNLPALVTVVLCYLWIGLTEAAAVTAVALNKFPTVTVLIREGTRALSPQLDDLARVFRPGPAVALRHIILPQLAPHVAGAARTGVALIWKVVLVVEFLGRPNGVGFQIHPGFQLFDVTLVLAYALCFIAVMLVVETALLRPWETRANRWRSG